MRLEDSVKEQFRLKEQHVKALQKMGIHTVRDLLYHFPARYGDTASASSIDTLSEGDTATVYGKINKLETGKTYSSKMSKATATISDETGTAHITWFRQPYLAKMISDGSIVKVTGKVSDYKGKLVFNNPKIESVSKLPQLIGNSLFGDGEHTLYPVYPESKGITSNWIYHAIQKVFTSGLLDEIIDPIPQKILNKYNLPSKRTALVWIHAPKKENDAQSARKRFAFEEIFFIQLKNQIERARRQEKKSFLIEPTKKEVQGFIDRFPFKLTDSQSNSINKILEDFKSSKPMSRLLEGDVGSGKTAVAAATIYATTITRPIKTQDFGNLQTAYMVPTEILAKQHFENFIEYFKHMPISVALITGSGCYKFPSKVSNEKYTNISRTQLLKWVANGEIPILIGTHALIQKTVNFKNLGYIVIDEQHRFGTAQRQKLARKDDFAPHLLSMTATPIPRTLALTIYGDLDLTLLDQMPSGRKPIITELVLPDGRKEVYEKIRTELKSGRQAYVICPRINEPDPEKETALNTKSVKAEAERLKKEVFKEYTIDILHSKMKPAEKDAVMKKFESGETKILVATSVVEVGVNVPNATSIIIEGAERFGLAQLHQLRGRVIRSNHQAYAYLFADTKSDKSIERLKALQSSKSGFELAEFDLQFRGAGDLYGRKQWGLTDLGMEAIKNIKMVEAARNESAEIVKKDPELKKHKDIAYELSTRPEVHFE
ncbi:MAG: ATP-dependent DNA helicase RecG [Candidatus Paceibacterota bacterium]